MLYLFFILSIIMRLFSFVYIYRIEMECGNIAVSSDQMLKSIRRKYTDYLSFGKSINDTNAFVNNQLISSLHTGYLEVTSFTAFLLFLGSVGVYYHLGLDEPISLLFKCIWGTIVYTTVCKIFDCRIIERNIASRITDYLSNCIGDSDNNSVAKKRREAFAFDEKCEPACVTLSDNAPQDLSQPATDTDHSRVFSDIINQYL